MTAKNIKRASIAGDQYYTPKWVVDQGIKYVLPKLGVVAPTRIIEPCAGQGIFVDRLRAKFKAATIVANDIVVPKAGEWDNADECHFHDYLRFGSGHTFDLGMTNPPFTYALEFAEQMIESCDVVVLFVRQGFLASQKRYAFFKQYRPCRVSLLTSRPSFAYNGQTDTADYCWVSWSKFVEPKTPTRLHWLPPPRSKK